MESSAQPDPAAIERLLARLEAFATHPGTLAIHDPLYLMRSEDPQIHLASLSAALEAHPNHPMVDEIRSALGDAVEGEELTLASVLVADGPIPPGVELVLEVQRRLKRHAATRGVLQERIQRLESNHDRMLGTTNAMTAMAAILSIFGLIGWLAALGVWEIPWLDPQEIAPEETEGDIVNDESR